LSVGYSATARFDTRKNFWRNPPAYQFKLGGQFLQRPTPPPPEFEDVLPDLIEITLHEKVCVPREGRDRPACGRRFV